MKISFWFFYSLLVLIMVGATAGTLWLYTSGDAALQTEIKKLAAAFFIQLATLVTFGALLKIAVEQITRAHEERSARRAFYAQITRNTRAIHAIVKRVPYLVEQKRTVEAYHSQIAQLFSALEKLKDLGDDIRSSGIRTLSDPGLGDNIRTMILYVTALLEESTADNITSWDDILVLPGYSDYRFAVLGTGQEQGMKPGKETRFFQHYDQHYTHMKKFMRDATGAYY